MVIVLSLRNITEIQRETDVIIFNKIKDYKINK